MACTSPKFDIWHIVAFKVYKTERFYVIWLFLNFVSHFLKHFKTALAFWTCVLTTPLGLVWLWFTGFGKGILPSVLFGCQSVCMAVISLLISVLLVKTGIICACSIHFGFYPTLSPLLFFSNKVCFVPNDIWLCLQRYLTTLHLLILYFWFFSFNQDLTEVEEWLLKSEPSCKQFRSFHYKNIGHVNYDVGLKLNVLQCSVVFMCKHAFWHHR